jgi:predicted RNA-binding protein
VLRRRSTHAGEKYVVGRERKMIKKLINFGITIDMLGFIHKYAEWANKGVY